MAPLAEHADRGYRDVTGGAKRVTPARRGFGSDVLADDGLAARRRSGAAASSGTPSDVTNDTPTRKASIKKAAKATKPAGRKASAAPSDSGVPASATTQEAKTPRPRKSAPSKSGASSPGPAA